MSPASRTFPLATLDAAALRNNLAVVRRLAPHSRVLAAVKADAYGHGLVPVARALADADMLGVARIEEALVLRDAGVERPIVLLEGCFSAEQLALAARHRLQTVVHSFEQVEMLEQCGTPPESSEAGFAVWLKLDTGMGRLGFEPEEFLAAHARLRRCGAVGQMRFMTHLASAEQLEDHSTPAQLQVFSAATDSLHGERSIANSAGVIAWPQAHLEWVRPGLMLYGLSPFAERSAASLGLRPVMTLSTELIAVRRMSAGQRVGYNGIWRAERPSLIGIAAIGYGDGYPRVIRVDAPVLVNGREAALAGRVSMDMIAVDVTDLPGVRVGAEVILWGEGLPAERVAAYAQTIAYELVCRVTTRVHRRWI